MIKLVMIFFIGLLLTGCVNNQEQAEDSPNTDKEAVQENNGDQNDKTDINQETTKQESRYPFPGNAQPIGDAKVTISTPAGTSEGGNVPVLFVESDLLMTQIGMDLENFQGDIETFVYVNKKFVQAQQVSELTQTSLDLEGDLLKPGTYTVTAVQFENNDPNGAVVYYAEAQYEVKKGSS